MNNTLKLGVVFSTMLLPGLLMARPGEFPDKDDRFFIRVGQASHKSALIENTFFLQNARALNQAYLGNVNLMVPVTEPKTETFFLNTWEFGYSFSSKSGLHRGNLTARYMGARPLEQNVAQVNRTGSVDSGGTTTETLQYQYDIYDKGDLRRYGLKYVSDFNILTDSGSDFAEGFGLRAGINLDHETYQTSGYRMESTVNYTTSSGSTTTSLANATINRINEADTDLNTYELIGGVVYKFPLSDRLHMDLGVDHYRGKGRGEVIYKSLSAPDGATLNSLITLMGTDSSSAQTAASTLNTLLTPTESNLLYYTNVLGNVYNIGLTFHVSPHIALRGYYRDERLRHSVRSTRTNGIAQDVEPILDAAIAAHLSGQSLNFNQAALQTIMSNVDDLGPRPKSVDRIKSGGLEIQMKF